MHATELFTSLIGGVALLLWGVRMVRTGMTRAFGATLRRVLAACAKSRFIAFGAGVGAAGLLQSSTAAALIVSSFAGRGLLTLAVALAVMLGADIGTTFAAQILSFDLGWLSPLLLAGGVFVFMGVQSDRVRNLARIAIGLGLMLLSLKLIVGASLPLRESATFAMVLGSLAGETVLAVLLAAVITWLAHSSLATVLLVMSLTASQVIPVPLALALVLGANLGGAFAPLAAQSGAPARARQVPLGNFLMRGIGVAACIPLLPYAAQLLATIEPAPARIVINAHTAFNVAVALVFLPLVDLVAVACARILPEPKESESPSQPRYLDADLTDSPSEALACAARETLNLGDKLAQMLRQTMQVFERDDAKLMKQVEDADNAVDRLYEAIKLYLVSVSRNALSEEESRRYVEILTFVTNLEHMGDIIDKNLMELAAKKIKNRYSFSPEGLAEIKRFHGRVSGNLQLAFNVFMTRDRALARRLLSEKSLLREAELAAAESHFTRLRQGRPESIETSSIHMDVVRDLKRINGHLTSVAYPILEAAGELSKSRLRDLREEPGPLAQPALLSPAAGESKSAAE
ncbi:MAG: Na/Pi cotransporter family protein [Alphaproteobacteria bacterium]|nr:Na/Pi cotransporter family protein [Alphaproteobacteria bacterium]